MEGMEMTEKEQATLLMDKFIDLQRIKTAGDKEKEIDYQLKTTKAKLEALGIVTENLTIDQCTKKLSGGQYTKKGAVT